MKQVFKTYEYLIYRYEQAIQDQNVEDERVCIYNPMWKLPEIFIINSYAFNKFIESEKHIFARCFEYIWDENLKLFYHLYSFSCLLNEFVSHLYL